MNDAYVSFENDPDARGKIRQLVEEEQENKLGLDSQVIDAESAVTEPRPKSHCAIVNLENTRLPTMASVRYTISVRVTKGDLKSMPEQRKAIAYTRVSAREKAISELSLEAQRRAVAAQAERSDLTIVMVLTDKDAPASTLNRPAMSQLIAHIDTGQVDAVIISRLDRLTRRIKDFSSLLQRMREAKRAGGGQGVDLISSAESLDTGSAAGRIAINIIDSISQWDRQVIGERTSAILQDLKAQGKSTGNPSYGFEAAEDGTLIENKQEQAVLQRVAELRAQRKSWAKVVNTLTSAGIRTRRGTVFSRQGLSKIAKRAGIK